MLRLWWIGAVHASATCRVSEEWRPSSSLDGGEGEGGQVDMDDRGKASWHGLQVSPLWLVQSSEHWSWTLGWDKLQSSREGSTLKSKECPQLLASWCTVHFLMCLWVSVLSNLCVKDGLRECFYSPWVVVRSKSWVPLKIHRCGLHLHCDQTRSWRSGWCIRALLDHSQTVIVFKSSVQFKQNSQDSFHWSKNRRETVLYSTFCSGFTCFHMFVLPLDFQHVVQGRLDSSALSTILTSFLK